jgi:DNA-binding transcriptional regulator YdaS (Cro superfamily)
MSTDDQSGIAEAVRRAGSQTNLAQILGVSQQFISSCLRKGYVPPHRALEIEVELGVPRSRLVNRRIAELMGTTCE